MRAHPRGCGADARAAVVASPREGSSPRVRGRLGADFQAGLESGLIPAGAGQTVSVRRGIWSPRAHPRGCGADERDITPAGLGEGSSPRVRGRHAVFHGTVHSTGLIPAGAGQTRIRGGFVDRGEGSSPRVRGRQIPELEARIRRGLIPAGAGQTQFHQVLCAWQGAHPRGCGADSIAFLVLWAAWGSSPRVRGRRSHPLNLRTTGGLIPAGAGQTACSGLVRACTRAHPRGCGADLWLR